MRSGFILLLSLLASTGLFAEPNRGITFVSDAIVSGYYSDLKLVGERLWCTNSEGVIVYDLADWQWENHPAELAHFTTSGQACGLFLQDTLCYVADYSEGLKIFDISNLNAVKELGSTVGAAGIKYVTVGNGVAFATAERITEGVYAINVQNPREPRILDFYEAHVAPQCLYLQDSLLWIDVMDRPTYQSAITALDVSDPTNLHVATQYWRRACGFTIQDQVAYIPGDDSLISLDISDIHNFRTLYRGRGGVSGTFYHDGFLYGDNSLFQVIYAQDPAHLRIGGGLLFDDTDAGSKVLAFYQNRIFGTAGYHGLKIVNVGDPMHPQLEHVNTVSGIPWDIAKQGDYLYVADGLSEYFHDRAHQPGRFRVVSIADLHHPREVAVVDSLFDPGGATEVTTIFVRDTVAFLGGCHQCIYSIADPEHPRLIFGSQDQEEFGISEFSTMYGDYIFNTYSEIDIYSVADPAAPRRLVRYPLDHDLDLGHYVIPTENYLYLIGLNNFEERLRIFDWSDPANLHEVGQSCELSPFAGTGDRRGDYLYITSGYAIEPLLQVVSIADPLNPRVVFTSQDVHWGYQTKIFGDYLFVTDWTDGIRVFSLENPERPQQIAFYNTPGSASRLDVDMDEGFIYLAEMSNVSIYDCGPLLGVWNLTLSDTTVDFGSVTQDSSLSYEFQIANQAEQAIKIDSARIAGFGFSMVESLDSVTIDAGRDRSVNLIFSPDSSREYREGLTIYSQGRIRRVALLGQGVPLSAGKDPSLPKTFALYPAYPNPFNSTTLIRFDLPFPTAIYLNIYDLSGRNVATLVSGGIQAGTHDVVWRAEGFTSGIYIVKMETPSFSTTRKVTLVK